MPKIIELDHLTKDGLLRHCRAFAETNHKLIKKLSALQNRLNRGCQKPCCLFRHAGNYDRVCAPLSKIFR